MCVYLRAKFQVSRRTPKKPTLIIVKGSLPNLASNIKRI